MSRDLVVYDSQTPVQTVTGPRKGHQYTNPDLYGHCTEIMRYGQLVSGRIFDNIKLMDRPTAAQNTWIIQALESRLAPFGKIIHEYNQPRQDPTSGDTKMNNAKTPIVVTPEQQQNLSPNTSDGGLGPSLTGMNWLSDTPVHYTVRCAFEGSDKSYAYRVHPGLRVDPQDLVVVRGSTGYQIVKVLSVDDQPSPLATAWVVTRVDTEFILRMQEEEALLRAINETVENALKMETANRLAVDNPHLKRMLVNLGDLRSQITR